MSLYGGLNLNAGSYYGSGYGSYSGKRVASSTNIGRVAKDIASGYSSDFEIINTYFKQGKTDKALALYDSLFDDVQSSTTNYGYTLTDSQVESILNSAYQNATGSTLLTTVDKTTSSAFATGLAEGIPLIGLFVNGTSRAEATAKLAGQSTDLKDKFVEGLGAVISNAGTYAAAGAAICGLPSGGIGAVPGAIIGGLAGAAVGILKTIFK